MINRHISDPAQRLRVFDPNGVHLATKKIGKNNPKAAEIEADNAARQEWNRTADMALLSGITEETQEQTPRLRTVTLTTKKHTAQRKKFRWRCLHSEICSRPEKNANYPMGAI